MNHAEIKKALEWRYATKIFDSTKKIPDTDWKILAESLVQTPSSFGLQPWKFLVVQNPELRNKLRVAAWNQSQVTDCSHFVVFLYKEKLDIDHIQKNINRMAEVRGVPLANLEAYKNVMIGELINGPRAKSIEPWAQRQTYIAMGFLMETAALLKVDTCPMEGLDPAEYDKILQLQGSGWKTIAAVAMGYRHPEDKYQHNKKVRFHVEDIIEYRK